jgi:hypothetical protein
MSIFNFLCAFCLLRLKVFSLSVTVSLSLRRAARGGPDSTLASPSGRAASPSAPAVRLPGTPHFPLHSRLRRVASHACPVGASRVDLTRAETHWRPGPGGACALRGPRVPRRVACRWRARGARLARLPVPRGAFRLASRRAPRVSRRAPFAATAAGAPAGIAGVRCSSRVSVPLHSL